MIMARKQEMAQAARIAMLDAGAHEARTEFVNNEGIEEICRNTTPVSLNNPAP